VRAVQERRSVSALRAVPPSALLVALGVVIVDHITKWWALRTLIDHNIDIVWKLRLNLVRNGGGAFGLGSRFAPLFALAALGIVLFLFRSGGTFSSRWSHVAVGLVLGGAVGNLLDRLLRDGHGFLGGRVVDFIDIQIWPVWNVVDMAVSIGAVLLALTADARTEE